MKVSYKNKRQAVDDNLSTEIKLSIKKSKQNPPTQRLQDLYIRRNITGDGNCLFRAVCFSLYKDDKGHAKLRHDVCEYMIANRSQFDGLLTQKKKLSHLISI